MASLSPSQELIARYLPGEGASVLLVNKDPRELSHYGTILRKVGCRVRASSSFAEGVQCLERGLYDLVLLDQGSDGFECREVLARAMEIDSELRVLVLARSHDNGCYLGMQSGALDYLEGPVSPADMIALLETFVPRRSGSHRPSRNPIKASKLSKKRTGKAGSNKVQSEMSGEYGEIRQSIGSAFRRGQSASGISDSRGVQN